MWLECLWTTSVSRKLKNVLILVFQYKRSSHFACCSALCTSIDLAPLCVLSIGYAWQVLAGSAEFRALNTPDKDRPQEGKEVVGLYKQLYRVRARGAARLQLDGAELAVRRCQIFLQRLSCHGRGSLGGSSIGGWAWPLMSL